MLLGSLPVALIVGTVLGFLTGLGVGGGSLLILWLTLVLEMPQTAARGINLLFFLPSAMIACYLEAGGGNAQESPARHSHRLYRRGGLFSYQHPDGFGNPQKTVRRSASCHGNPGTVLPAKIIAQPFRFLYARYPSRISDAATASTVSFRFFP